MTRSMALVAAMALLAAGEVARPQSFANFETPPVSPMAITPDGSRLLVVNTPDNRLEVFSLGGAAPVRLASIPVGLEPVSVRARTDSEAWVVNHLSDSVSIVDLSLLNVRTTINPGDEPCDVVFAGTPQRAFVSVSQENLVRVYDPANPAAAPQTVAIQGEDPRALATDGVRVFAAVFESGNRTTVINETAVSTAANNPYPGDPNPPPNSGSSFVPALRAGLPAPPRVGLILKKDAGGAWRDDNIGNWSSAVTWDVHDNDVAIINVSTLGVTYARGAMNINMALGLRAGLLTVVGTDALNQRRFEPNVRGRFLRVNMATFETAAPAAISVFDLNPHLTYSAASIPAAQREQSIGDPRAIVWNAAGTVGYVAGMGSNNVAVISPTGTRLGRIDVGQGPAGLALDAPRSRLYVLNRFDASLSIIDTVANAELTRVGFYDPTPLEIREGRPFLYDTHAFSGLGHTSCASCHVDATLDQLAWDLGDPSGQMKTFNQVCNFGFGGCENWHPMKGPMTTQTLVGIIGTGPLHWRADREDLAAFNPAFPGLLAADRQLTPGEMAQFEAFIASIRTPPNPFRNIDNSLRSALPNGGNAVTGLTLYTTVNLDGNAGTCVACHALPTGTNGQLTSANLLQETQSMKIPQLRNMHEKTGFSRTSMSNNRGFGYSHDGTVDTLFSFLSLPVFTFAAGATGQQQRRDVEAFLLSFSTDTHAAVGQQVTIAAASSATPQQLALIDTMISLANGGSVGLVVKGVVGGLQRGYAYSAGQFLSDRQSESLSPAALRALSQTGGELTYTVVVNGTQTRIGIDRDLDGYRDRDEIDAGSDPASPFSVPPADCAGDTNGDNVVNGADLSVLLSQFGQSVTPGTGADFNIDGVVNGADLSVLLSRFGTGC